MDSFGDYIYIILLVIAAISGLFKMRGKNNPQTETPPQKSWEELMQELAAETKAEPYAPVVTAEEPKVAVVRPTMGTPTTYHTPAKQKTPMQSSYKTTSTPATVELISDDLEDIQFETAYDARRAFIYAEIFQRKWT